DDLLKWFPLEQRVYRMRCVEAWSMVIPWLGFSLASLIQRLEPTGNAKFVEFITKLDPRNMPGERVPILDWPYVEALRLDEALHRRVPAAPHAALQRVCRPGGEPVFGHGPAEEFLGARVQGLGFSVGQPTGESEFGRAKASDP